MPRRIAQKVFPREEKQLQDLGQRLRAARLRRRIPVGEMAARVGIDRKTQWRLEQGDPSVSLAVLVRTLNVLGLSEDLDELGAKDEIGRRLAEIELPERPHRKVKGTS